MNSKHVYRHYRVFGTNDCVKKVTSGFPQGTVFGPLLFLICTNDMVFNLSLTIKLLTDDSVLYSENSSIHDDSLF